ncbi:glycosyltransferase family 2 protein [bacterium]|nr:glycosyltransferase family 2 protein [bacterium]
MKLSVVIPVYNEELTIKEVIDKVMAVPIDKEIIVVDDGSTDRTPEILKESRDKVTIIYNSLINIGKGAAIRIGFEHIKGDVVIIQDGDLELDPSEYPRIVGPIMEGKADVVYGSRFLGEKGRKETSLVNYLANKLLTFLTNVLYKTNITDMETAYKCFRADVIKKMRLKSIGFEIEPELTAKALRLGYKIYEVPISYHPRRIEEGKKIGFMDGFKAIYYLFKWRFAGMEEIEK